jgi:hypothetical protein
MSRDGKYYCKESYREPGTHLFKGHIYNAYEVFGDSDKSDEISHIYVFCYKGSSFHLPYDFDLIVENGYLEKLTEDELIIKDIIE